ncbi:MAG: DUF2309 domain-containing protein [Rhodocyclaceae bacterium]|nr:DUF2309 domain-containing protein [Rhodocyclaceae bacterium]
MAAANNYSARQRIEECLHHLGHVLPSQASIRDFVHHNTLHGFQHLPFPEALAAADRLTGAPAWLPEDDFRGFYRSGRIDDTDLAAACAEVARLAKIDLAAVLATPAGRPVTRGDVLRLGLIHSLAPIPLAQLRWQVEEMQALERCHADVPAACRAAFAAAGDEAAAVGELWAACLDLLSIDAGFAHPETLLEASAREEQGTGATRSGAEAFAPRAAALWETLTDKVGAGPSQADAPPAGGSEPGLRAWGANKVGAGGTAGELIEGLTGEDVPRTTRALLLRHFGAHLDLGLAPWHNPARTLGFYAAWKQCALRDLVWTLDSLDISTQDIAALPDDPMDAVVAEFARLGLPEERWAGYLERLALELPGWSGMFLWRQEHPGYAGTPDVPVVLLDFLAVRLIVERIVCDDIARRHWGICTNLDALGAYFREQPAEFWVRHAYHEGELPEYLLDLIEPHLPAVKDAALPSEPGLWVWLAECVDIWRQSQFAPTAERTAGHGPARSAWPLFRLAQHLGMHAAALRALGAVGAEALLQALDCLDADQRGYLWLLAYERHYREQILGCLAANHGRWPGHASGPAAQLVFCMDDREEGVRRHLEEIAPEYETLGGAAHFAVYQNYYGLDDTQPTPLCPVIPEVIVPAHNVHEVPIVGAGPSQADAGLPPLGVGGSEPGLRAWGANKVGAGETAQQHARRIAFRLRWRERWHQLTRHGFLSGLALMLAGTPFAFASQLLRTVLPGRFGDRMAAWRAGFDVPVATRLDFIAPNDAGPATPQAPRDGFTDAEQAERVGNFLIALGLTHSFAPLVVIMGHGSNSQNNPHMAAYDCGACSGRHSGPNARLFAAMANRPAVRALLAVRDIHIPDGTWLLAAEHNTADDRIEWYDVAELPDALRPCLAALDVALDQACRAHARERCRRLYSAPLGMTPDGAFAHVLGRRHDWSQTRPELGHATNACAFFGRRDMSRGAFFDRRAFLISYDPTRDPDGKVLERHLLINGAVGAGISLEYYFSTANNAHFGCGSKVTHNVAGYCGVMQGASSDLVTGLPRQMIEVHEAMRLLVVIEQKLDLITAVYQRQPPLQELVGNRWVIVVAKDPESGAMHRFDPELGWLPWQGNREVPTVRESTDWFTGQRDPLPPVLLEKPLQVAA